jgi:hypothetical protein
MISAYMAGLKMKSADWRGICTIRHGQIDLDDWIRGNGLDTGLLTMTAAVTTQAVKRRLAGGQR